MQYTLQTSMWWSYSGKDALKMEKNIWSNHINLVHMYSTIIVVNAIMLRVGILMGLTHVVGLFHVFGLAVYMKTKKVLHLNLCLLDK